MFLSFSELASIGAKLIVAKILGSLLIKEKIVELIKNNDSSVTYVSPTTASSQVWQSFRCIYVNNQKQSFVSCDKCKNILYHKSIDGTTHVKFFSIVSCF